MTFSAAVCSALILSVAAEYFVAINFFESIEMARVALTLFRAISFNLRFSALSSLTYFLETMIFQASKTSSCLRGTRTD